MDLRIITSNIRYDDPKDGKHQWCFRKNIWLKSIKAFGPHILGTQEGLHPQILDFCPEIEPLQIVDQHRTWLFDRMYPNLFFHKQYFKLIRSGDIWLSKTPHVPASLSFNSLFPRLAIWAHLAHIESGDDLLVLNTHLDHLHGETRLEQINVLMQEVKKLKITAKYLIIMGDFNEGPLDGVQERIFHSLPNIVDPWAILKKQEIGSHHKFDGHNDDKKRIDWILVSNNFKITRIDFDPVCSDCVYPSDHFPVKLELSF